MIDNAPPEHQSPPPNGRGGFRPGAGAKPKTEKTAAQKKQSADRLAKVLFGAVEKRAVIAAGDKWKADDAERSEIIDAGGDVVLDLIEDYPSFLRLGIALGAYTAARAEAPKGLWQKTKDKFSRDEKKDAAADATK